MDRTNIFPDEYGFISTGNLSSPYCIISSLKNKSMLEDFKDYAGFILYIVDKYIKAGLPEESIIGTTIRRLLIGLSRCPNTYKIYYLADENKSCGKMYSTIHGLIRSDETLLEQVYQMGKMWDYGIEIKNIRDIFSRIKSIAICEISDSDRPSIERLKSKMRDDLCSIDKIQLPNESNFLNWYPTFEVDTKLKVDIPSFTKMVDIYNYAEGVLLSEGRIGKDRDNLMRIQLNDSFTVGIGNYTIREFEKFLESRYGINKSSGLFDGYPYEKGDFSKRLRGENGDPDSYDEFIMELKKAITNNQLCYSKTLSLTNKKDSGYNKTQIGWECITPYLEYNNANDMININLHHRLRSVDLYDGFPFNLYFCIKISDDIIDILRADISNVQLGSIFINIAYLHAYVDSIPEKIYLSKIQ
ncbi:MAG: hypothetical protein U9N61_03880 [Euryarchaeota archaeon]|nr:hypothetical protein [Euryarchaeota archaeon]